MKFLYHLWLVTSSDSPEPCPCHNQAGLSTLTKYKISLKENTEGIIEGPFGKFYYNGYGNFVFRYINLLPFRKNKTVTEKNIKYASIWT